MRLQPYTNRKGIMNEWTDGVVHLTRFFDGLVRRNIYRADWVEAGKLHGKDVYGREGDQSALSKLIASLPASVRARVPALDWSA